MFRPLPVQSRVRHELSLCACAGLRLIDLMQTLFPEFLAIVEPFHCFQKVAAKEALRRAGFHRFGEGDSVFFGIRPKICALGLATRNAFAERVGHEPTSVALPDISDSFSLQTLVQLVVSLCNTL